MVERPIKKSERAARGDGEGSSDREKTGSDREGRGGDRRERSGGPDRKGGRGKGRGDREEVKPSVPLALMRGPRPKPKVEAPEPEPVPEESTGEVGASEDPTADAETPTEVAAEVVTASPE